MSGGDWGGGWKFKLVEKLRWPSSTVFSWETPSPSLLKTFHYTVRRASSVYNYVKYQILQRFLILAVFDIKGHSDTHN